MKLFAKLVCLILALVMVTGCGLIADAPADDKATKPQGGTVIFGGDNENGIYISSGKLDELMDLVEEKFIGESDRAAMEDAAAAAIVESLGDRWSYYIPASQMQDYNDTMSNSYVGIGITIQVREDEQGFDIAKVEKNGPAYEAGIQPGDILIGADGTNLAGKTTDEAATLVKGEEGTTVEITVKRDGKDLTFTVERRTIEVTVAEARMLPSNIGVVLINNFDARCASETIACIESLIAQGATSLIFDVRYNPGGYAHEMVELLDYLLPEGELFITEDYLGNRQVDSSDANCLDMPMVVLVNEDSYSAAEFFASALRDYEWATVVGGKTIGKGYFQQALMLSDGSAVNLSVGKYYTRSGISLAEQGGLTPDVPVEVDEEMYMNIYYGTVADADDPQLQAAVKVLTQK